MGVPLAYPRRAICQLQLITNPPIFCGVRPQNLHLEPIHLDHNPQNLIPQRPSTVRPRHLVHLPSRLPGLRRHRQGARHPPLQLSVFVLSQQPRRQPEPEALTHKLRHNPETPKAMLRGPLRQRILIRQELQPGVRRRHPSTLLQVPAQYLEVLHALWQ
jgi:hypothetical protein